MQWVQPSTLPTDPAQLRAEHVVRVQTMEEQLLTAVRIDQFVHDHKPVLPCAVCSCYVGRVDVAEDSCALADLPGLELLDASLPPTDELPRAGLTHLVHDGVKYCLSPEGVTSAPGAPLRVRVCNGCWRSLSKKKPEVPPRSLVRVDTGPPAADDRGPLPTPTYVERVLLGSVAISRKIMVLRPTKGFGIQKKELTGHVVVVPATSVEKLHSMLVPRSFDELPELLTVRT